MKDIQSTADTRGIAIDQVGITNLRYPISVKSRGGKPMPTVADISMSVHLPHHFKGTHMSRFLEILSKHQDEITLRSLPAILHELKKRLEAESAHMEVSFPYFIDKAAPVSGARAKICCQCTFLGVLQREEKRYRAARRCPGHHTLSVQQGNQRLRSTQPTRARHNRGAAAKGQARLGMDLDRRAGRDRREIRLSPRLCAPQAPR